VGAPVSAEFAEVRHETPMLSMANTYTDEEVRKWMESMPYPDADRFVASGEDDSGAEPAPEE